MLSLPLPFSPSHAQCMMFPSLCPCVLIVQHLLMSEHIRSLFFCSCVSLLGMMIFSFIHVPGKDMNSLFLWLHIIPWCICATFSLSSLSLMGIWVGSSSLPLSTVPQWTYVCVCLYNRMIYNPLDIYPEMGLLSQMEFLFLGPWGIAKIVEFTLPPTV